MAYSALTFTAGEVPTLSKWNQLWANDAAFNNGTGFAAGAIPRAALANAAINNSKIDFTTSGNVWWEELGRNTASGNPTSMSVTLSTSRKYLRIILLQLRNGATLASTLRFNNDSGANYGYRSSENGGADTSANAQAGVSLGSNTLVGMFADLQVLNIASMAKQGFGFQDYFNTSANGTDLYRNQYAFQWNNAAAQISSVNIVATSGAYANGSELIVLGHD